MMMAVVLLMLVLTAMGSMLLMSRTAIYAKDDETAGTIAFRFMEEQEGRPFSDFADASKFPSCASFGGGKYKATASVLSGDAFSATVRVAVVWNAAVGTKKETASIERVISAGGHRNVGGLI
jgi:hypothetical protein